jgi:hypothetical protein
VPHDDLRVKDLSDKEYLSKFFEIEVRDIKIENFNEIHGKKVWIKDASLYKAHPYTNDYDMGAAFIIEDRNIDKKLAVETYGEDSFYLALASKQGDSIEVGGQMDARRPIPKITAEFIINRRVKF